MSLTQKNVKKNKLKYRLVCFCFFEQSETLAALITYAAFL